MNKVVERNSRALKSIVDAAYQTVADHAESIANDQAHDLSQIEPGEAWPQGDLLIERLPDDFVAKHYHLLAKESRPSLQLAPGTTQGSRHCLESLAGVTVLRLTNPTPLDGPVLVTKQPIAIRHPEHGDVENLPPGCYVITYQRAYAEELRAVAD